MGSLKYQPGGRICDGTVVGVTTPQMRFGHHIETSEEIADEKAEAELLGAVYNPYPLMQPNTENPADSRFDLPAGVGDIIGIDWAKHELLTWAPNLKIRRWAWDAWRPQIDDSGNPVAVESLGDLFDYPANQDDWPEIHKWMDSDGSADSTITTDGRAEIVFPISITHFAYNSDWGYGIMVYSQKRSFTWFDPQYSKSVTHFGIFDSEGTWVCKRDDPNGPHESRPFIVPQIDTENAPIPIHHVTFDSKGNVYLMTPIGVAPASPAAETPPFESLRIYKNQTDIGYALQNGFQTPLPNNYAINANFWWDESVGELFGIGTPQDIGNANSGGTPFTQKVGGLKLLGKGGKPKIGGEPGELERLSGYPIHIKMLANDDENGIGGYGAQGPLASKISETHKCNWSSAKCAAYFHQKKVTLIIRDIEGLYEVQIINPPNYPDGINLRTLAWLDGEVIDNATGKFTTYKAPSATLDCLMATDFSPIGRPTVVLEP